MSKYVNYFVKGLTARGTTGIIEAEKLRHLIENHDGGEAFHCAFDLLDSQLKVEEDLGADKPAKERYRYHAQTPENLKHWPKSHNEYEGTFKPALDRAWFDFDSHDGGVQALEDTRKFVAWLGIHDAFICYSGSKGFHVGVPFSCFGLLPSPELGKILNRLAAHLKKTYPTLDTTVFNASRKFRALGSRHPKTGLHKIQLHQDYFMTASLDEIKTLAKERGNLVIEDAALRSPLDKITALLAQLGEPEAPKKKGAANVDVKEWIAPTGKDAFNKCGFLKNVRDNPTQINEPQWYAALSIVARFQDGRKQCHEISRTHPRYNVTETNEKINQAEQASAPRTCESISTLWSGCKECPLLGKINSPVNIFETRFYDRGDKGRLIPNYNDLLNEYSKTHPFKTISDMKTVHNFSTTHYKETNPIKIKAFAENNFEPKPQEKYRQEFCHKVFANNVVDRDFFTQGTEGRINFKNGVLDLDTGNLLAHSAEFGFRNVLPYEFNPQAQAISFDAWIKDVMLGDEALVNILQEFMGYVVRGGEYKYHKALWLSGSGRNGKSTFLSVLKALIGTSNYSTLSIKQITGDKFASADLDGKIANFSEETSPEELSDSGPFKNLTGDGELLAQKKYGDPYSFRNRAKLIMTYNEVPILKDISPGMMSRPIIIPWKKDLTDESAQDKDLKSKLLAELSGIFNFALAGWRRLESNQAFTFSSKCGLSLREIETASCSATRWVEEQVIFMPGDTGKTYDPSGLYAAYKSWHSSGGGQPMGEMKFLKRINMNPEMSDRKRHQNTGAEYFALRIVNNKPDAAIF
jgi:P4 family phage/plasmid primase-like protien